MCSTCTTPYYLECRLLCNLVIATITDEHSTLFPSCSCVRPLAGPLDKRPSWFVFSWRACHPVCPPTSMPPRSIRNIVRESLPRAHARGSPAYGDPRLRQESWRITGAPARNRHARSELVTTRFYFDRTCRWCSQSDNITSFLCLISVSPSPFYRVGEDDERRRWTPPGNMPDSCSLQLLERGAVLWAVQVNIRLTPCVESTLLHFQLP